MFETPTHGEKFDRRGNYYAGPASKGLDRYPIAVEGDAIYVDLETVIPGPERGTEEPLEPEGSFCDSD
jgi:Rieske Fe-S protein